MITIDLNREIQESILRKRSTCNFKNYIFSLVEESLIQIYGNNYSDRCVQSSVGIQQLLSGFGIKSKLIEGSICIAIVRGNNPYKVNWGGFWGDEHHMWVMTEFYEIIDFKISKFHLHANHKGELDIQPIPPVWWLPSDISPPIFRYLPKSLNQNIRMELEGTEKENLDLFQKSIEIHRNRSCHDHNFNPILHGPETLNALLEQGNHWVRGGFVIQQNNVQFPAWIIDKENELMQNYSNGYK